MSLYNLLHYVKRIRLENQFTKFSIFERFFYSERIRREIRQVRGSEPGGQPPPGHWRVQGGHVTWPSSGYGPSRGASW
jgi:hypothetical protein